MLELRPTPHSELSTEVTTSPYVHRADPPAGHFRGVCPVCGWNSCYGSWLQAANFTARHIWYAKRRELRATLKAG